jgi:multiple sugar transport system ATP-binding protein
MVFQSYALYPHMTVAENMGFALTLKKIPRSEIAALVLEAARMLGLEALLERKPAQLSGGQRQRVAVGRAIVREPKVFLFDEPLSNLDAALREQMRVELKRLHARLGTTMVYVTHDQIEAMTLASRIAVLDAGLVQQFGTPAEIFDTPATTFVARFIGTPTINLLPMTREGDVLEGPAGKVTGARLPDGLPPKLLVGVRPHVLGLHKPGQALALDARVDVIEPIGWEAHVHLTAGDLQLTSLMTMAEVQHLRPGAAVALGAVATELHLFDAASGVRVGGAG